MLDMRRAVDAKLAHAVGRAGPPPRRTRLGPGLEAGARPADAQDFIAKRLVFHVGGYEPLSPAAMHHRFVRELRRFETTWSVTASVSDAEAHDNGATWQVAAIGPNWRVDTDYRLMRWDDLIDEASRQPMWRRIPRGLLAFADFVAGGALWGYFRSNWRYALFFLYPYLLFTALAALAAFIGGVTAQALGSVAGVAAGVLSLAILLRWPGRRLYLPLMFDDWIFARTYVRSGHPVLEARLESGAAALVAAAREDQVDEIVIIGHSLGAVLAVDLVDRALRLDPALGRSGPHVALLTVGSSIPKIGLHRGARRFRAALQRVASATRVFWAEYQALLDVMNFYKTDPVKALGLQASGRPVIRVVRLSRMLDPAFYKRIKRNFFRLHRQFVSGNDRRATYDYFMLVCGPIPAERQARLPEGAASAIAPDGALLTNSADAVPPSAEAGKASS